jgi:hypothetical protein
VRTTVRLDERLLVAAKRQAAESGQTLTALLESALREKLGRRQRPDTRVRTRLHTVKGDGVQPGVDLDDSASLLDVMES